LDHNRNHSHNRSRNRNHSHGHNHRHSHPRSAFAFMILRVCSVLVCVGNAVHLGAQFCAAVLSKSRPGGGLALKHLAAIGCLNAIGYKAFSGYAL
jgi:hypothetical protein